MSRVGAARGETVWISRREYRQTDRHQYHTLC